MIKQVSYLVGAMSLLSILQFSSCANGGSGGKELDTPSKGEIKISVDANYEPIIDSELQVFHAQRPAAKIIPRYAPEADVVNDLLLDSARLIIASRLLTAAELDTFEKLKSPPKVVHLATDAIAFIVHPSSSDSTLTMSELRDVLNGKINKWQQLNPKSKQGVITLVFDNEKSSTVRYVMDSLCQGAALPANAFATKTNEETIKYVSENPNAIGIIGVNWISDTTDPKTQAFNRKIRAVALAKKIGMDYYKPYQAYIATGDYPVTRKMYSISREMRSGLGTGLSAYLAAEKGQRIILKSGLVPSTMPLRIVSISSDPIE